MKNSRFVWASLINSFEVLISVMSFFMFSTKTSSHTKELLNFQKPRPLLLKLSLESKISTGE